MKVKVNFSWKRQDTWMLHLTLHLWCSALPGLQERWIGAAFAVLSITQRKYTFSLLLPTLQTISNYSTALRFSEILFTILWHLWHQQIFTFSWILFQIKKLISSVFIALDLINQSILSYWAHNNMINMFLF